MFFLSTLGKLQLAAGAIASATSMPVLASISGVFSSLGILVTQYRGEGREASDIGQLVSNALFLSLILTLPIILLLYNTSTILLYLNLDPQIVSFTTSYFHYAAAGLLPAIFTVIASQFYAGIGKPGYTLLSSLLCLPFTLCLSYSLILGKFGFPELGLAGISCALFIVQSLQIFVLITFLYFHQNLQKYRILPWKSRIDFSLCKKILTLGFPIGIQYGSELAAMATVACFMGYFGVAALAAYQIVSQYAMCIAVMTLGISQAGGLVISEAYTKNDTLLVKEYLLAAFILYAIIFSFIAGIFLYIPEKLISLFIDPLAPENNVIVHLALILFAISSILLFIDAIRSLFSSALRGMRDSKVPMKTSIFCLWFISIPLSIFLGFILEIGPIGLRIGFSGGFVVSVIWLFIRIRQKLFLAHSQAVVFNTKFEA